MRMRVGSSRWTAVIPVTLLVMASAPIESAQDRYEQIRIWETTTWEVQAQFVKPGSLYRLRVIRDLSLSDVFFEGPSDAQSSIVIEPPAQLRFPLSPEGHKFLFWGVCRSAISMRDQLVFLLAPAGSGSTPSLIFVYYEPAKDRFQSRGFDVKWGEFGFDTILECPDGVVRNMKEFEDVLARSCTCRWETAESSEEKDLDQR